MIVITHTTFKMLLMILTAESVGLDVMILYIILVNYFYLT